MNVRNELKSLFTEHWKYFAISTSCKLKLFDKIQNGQNTTEKLCNENNWHLKSFSHLINYLIDDNYLEMPGKSELSLTEKGSLLIESNPESLFYACLNWSAEHLDAWVNLEYSIKSGLSSFEHLHQQPFFEFLNNHPDKLENYHRAMYQYAVDDYKYLPSLIDFSIHQSIMDVGGGYGAAINIIQKRYPVINCILFDLKQVVANTSSENIQILEGNFFYSVPKIADAIILSRIIHDWNDEKSLVILENCFKALPDHGVLYVIENCTDHVQGDLSLLSINMAVMCESQERSSKEYIDLCSQTGFKYQNQKPLNPLQTILTFSK